MTTKTTRRNIDIISKEEWKALDKALELNRTHLLRSGMGTGTGIGDYGQYHNVMLQGNTFMGSTSGVYSNYSEQIQDDYYDFYNSVCNPTWNWIFYRRKYCRRRGKSYKFFILECYNGYSLSMRSHI